MTRGGHVCASWLYMNNSVCKDGCEYLYEYEYEDYRSEVYIPDGSLEDAANYCRSPNNDRRGPWCFYEYYDTDEDRYKKWDWDYCDVPYCGGNELIIPISIDSMGKVPKINL